MKIQKKKTELKKLTVERVRSIKKFAGLTEEQALKVIKSIEEFSQLTYNLFKNIKRKKNEELDRSI
jgi:hypothetical protein